MALGKALLEHFVHGWWEGKEKRDLSRNGDTREKFIQTVGDHPSPVPPPRCPWHGIDSSPTLLTNITHEVSQMKNYIFNAWGNVIN